MNLDFPTDTGKIDRSFRFERTNGEWRINGLGFADVANRILAKPQAGTTEVWELVNKSGGWGHPIHIHLVDFKVLTRSGRGVESYESSGFKVTLPLIAIPWCILTEQHRMLSSLTRMRP